MGAIQQMLLGGKAEGSDPYYASVTSLLHFDGANGDTTFTDRSGKTWTAGGAAQLSTSDPKFGSAALSLNGSNSFVTTAIGSDWNFGSGDFTFECFIKPTSPSASLETIFSLRPTIGDAGLQVSYRAAGMSATCWNSGGSLICTMSAADAVIGGVWHHVAYTRNGNNFYLFLDGALTGSVTGSGTLGNAGSVIIGKDPSVSGPRYTNGMIDEFRMTKGIARYTASFSVPVSAFPNY